MGTCCPAAEMVICSWRASWVKSIAPVPFPVTVVPAALIDSDMVIWAVLSPRVLFTAEMTSALALLLPPKMTEAAATRRTTTRTVRAAATGVRERFFGALAVGERVGLSVKEPWWPAGAGPEYAVG